MGKVILFKYYIFGITVFKMKVSLIITTYNWVSALSAVLDSVKKQSILPGEVIIADDGSNDLTKKINRWWNR